MSNLNTPENEINPPSDNKRYITCKECQGEGKILIEVESEDSNEDFEYDTEICSNCKGDGIVKNE